MSTEEQRIAIAQACGLDPQCVPFVPAKVDATGWFSPMAATEFYRAYPRASTVKIIPDYLNDLNAMHEAIMSMESQYWAAFLHWLEVVCAKGQTGLTGSMFIVNATAAQRAEAFLRALNLWKE